MYFTQVPAGGFRSDFIDRNGFLETAPGPGIFAAPPRGRTYNWQAAFHTLK